MLSKQLLRSGTSIGANVEEAEAGQSRKDFLAKMYIAAKEARETRYWLRLLQDSKIVDIDLGNELSHANELIRILAANIKTTVAKLAQQSKPKENSANLSLITDH